MIRPLLLLSLVVAALVAADPRARIGLALHHAGLPGLAAPLLDGPDWAGAVAFAQGRFDEAAELFEGRRFAGATYDRGTALARAGRLDEAEAALNEALFLNPNDDDARHNLALVEAAKAKRERVERDARNGANARAAKQKRGGEAPTDAENDVNSTGEGMAGDRDSGREAQSPGGSQVTRAGRAEQSRISDEREAARGSIGAAEGAGRTGGEQAPVAQQMEQPALKLRRSHEQQAVSPSVQWLRTLADDPGRYLKLRLAAERARRAERGVAAPAGTEAW
ncbi:hypothetical protein GCM10008171_12720 [Methylopila jiangsuensis]|uniref:Tetratricopeptide repeat protein n=1 Tax=Methylopila jiangsuensis TaxID=586230 RepID=A0A9W6N381_9HYPH|nr:tetratricopeptide repeat protein [Methylopila jiangsuensis]MDR6286255.1 tetratricopeptide (TPR) repeat protein [Methylopila jiangsuensis]GLK76018.1 hypothetical protein GCM10008171_12720 [Methylopila jiangsuensis]